MPLLMAAHGGRGSPDYATAGRARTGSPAGAARGGKILERPLRAPTAGYQSRSTRARQVSTLPTTGGVTCEPTLGPLHEGAGGQHGVKVPAPNAGTIAAPAKRRHGTPLAGSGFPRSVRYNRP